MQRLAKIATYVGDFTGNVLPQNIDGELFTQGKYISAMRTYPIRLFLHTRSIQSDAPSNEETSRSTVERPNPAVDSCSSYLLTPPQNGVQRQMRLTESNTHGYVSTTSMSSHSHEPSQWPLTTLNQLTAQPSRQSLISTSSNSQVHTTFNYSMPQFQYSMTTVPNLIQTAQPLHSTPRTSHINSPLNLESTGGTNRSFSYNETTTVSMHLPEDYPTNLVHETAQYSTYTKAALRNHWSPRKRLEVLFVGEDAIDGGGPTREFLTLFMKQLSESSLFFRGNKPKVSYFKRSSARQTILLCCWADYIV
ncbi:uncharacterized protein LOC141910316 [Tubulanus polymorphus]|uniref:uncharacterized protein LOC141910316 n=1 Tax=Tubulanus polymorphus TaxID=672921 RepID=UPI003DA69BF1